MAADLPPDRTPTYSRQYRRCGKATCGTCRPGAPGHGPYWYAYWWEQGHLHSRYVGKHEPPGRTPAAMPAWPPLRVRTLGGLELWRGDELIRPARWGRRAARDLLTCLLCAPSHRLHRLQIADVLWPEATLTASAASLRAAVHLLREELDGRRHRRGDPRTKAGYVHSEGGCLALVPAPNATPADDWLDSTAFAAAAKAALGGRDPAACRAALTLYRGDYLPDDIYKDWTIPRREELHRQHLALLLHLADLSVACGAVADAEQALRDVLARDPAHETAAQRLIALLTETGRRAEALRVYRALVEALRDDLNLAPAGEAEALHRRLLARGPRRRLPGTHRAGRT